MKAAFVRRALMIMAVLGAGSFDRTGLAASFADRIGKGALNKLVPDLLKIPDRIDIPVSWRQTRARFRPTGASTQTESFRETWRLSSDGSGGGWLESGRAKVRVLKKTQPGPMPFSLIIEEKALGQLLGIIKSQWNIEESDAQPPVIYQLNLSSPGEILKLVINFSEEEHYAIQLQVGQVDFRSI
jgi:hypothetical protein